MLGRWQDTNHAHNWAYLLDGCQSDENGGFGGATRTNPNAPIGNHLPKILETFLDRGARDRRVERQPSISSEPCLRFLRIRIVRKHAQLLEAMPATNVACHVDPSIFRDSDAADEHEGRAGGCYFEDGLSGSKSMNLRRSPYSMLVTLALWVSGAAAWVSGAAAWVPGAAAWADDSFGVIVPDGPERQLSRYTILQQGDRVSIGKKQTIDLPFAPSGIATDPTRQRLFVTAGGRNASTVATIALDDADHIELIQTSPLQFPAGYTSVDRSGKYFLTANYPAGIIAAYPIADDGTIGNAICSRTTPTREAHCILTTPDNRFVYIPCVKNNNALYQYAFEEATGNLTELDPHNASPPAMFGPRHVAYHTKRPIAYFSNEQQLGVSVYEINQDGQLHDLQHATTMARRSPYVQGERDMHASDLVVTPDGHLLFVAVRDFVGDEDSIFGFRIEDDGRLSKVSRTLCGDIPWKLALSPAADLLLVSESADKSLSIFRVEANGKLSRVSRLDWGVSARDMAVSASNQPKERN